MLPTVVDLLCVVVQLGWIFTCTCCVVVVQTSVSTVIHSLRTDLPVTVSVTLSESVSISSQLTTQSSLTD